MCVAVCVALCVAVCVEVCDADILAVDSPFFIFLDGYCSTLQGLLDWFEVDLGFTELLFIQIDLCVLCVVQFPFFTF